MAYDLYPAVDENYNFPPEVRAALAKSVELRQVATPMTTVDRNNLTGADLWDGRLILNITEDRVQRYDGGTSSWSTLAEGIDAILPMTEAVRDNLSGSQLFNGRMIFNTDQERINRYDSSEGVWRVVGEVTNTVVPGTESGTGVIGTSTEAARADHAHPAMGGSASIQTFTASGTWTKPAGAKVVQVIAHGAGGAGASGIVGSSTDLTAGGGGAGGACHMRTILASDIPTSTVPVTVGAGGVATMQGSSNSGAPGGQSTFGDFVKAGGGAGGGRPGQTNGSSGSGQAGTPWGLSKQDDDYDPEYGGNPGISGSRGGGQSQGGSSVYGGGGGASGSNTGSSWNVSNGGIYPGGASGNGLITGGMSGTNSNTAGVPAQDGAPGQNGYGPFGGSGGGGGGSTGTTAAAAAGKGGVGGLPGGGGGGGGNSQGGGTGGLGGNGGRGQVTVITYF